MDRTLVRGWSIFLLTLFSGLNTSGQNLLFHLLPQQSLAPFTWTGLAGNSNWNTAGNWSNNAVPGPGDVAKFYGEACSGAQCNATLNATVNVYGIEVNGTYTGTITQGSGIAVTIGTSGWSQSNGSFVGSNGTITFNGPFTLAGGKHRLSLV